MRSFLFVSIFALTVGCYRPMPTAPVETHSNGGDSNGDGIQDSNQSIGRGHQEGNGQPYVVYFTGPQLPGDRTNLWQIGFGCSVYDSNMTDDWETPCVPLVPYMVDGVTIGYAFVDIREGTYEGVPFDANGGNFANLEQLEVTGDEAGFIVTHVDGQDCPVDEQLTAFHYGFRRVGDDIVPLGESVAPPDPDCH